MAIFQFYSSPVFPELYKTAPKARKQALDAVIYKVIIPN